MAYKICTRCIMDTTDPDITFNSEGYCNHCTRAKVLLEKFYLPDSRGAARLRDIIEKIKTEGKGQPYDCIIGLSGGVDSSYLAYKSKEWGLRPLLFHVDGGWNTPQSQANVENLAAWLRYDLHTYKVAWEEMRDLQKAYLRSGLANQDVPQDHLFFAVLFRETEGNKIKYWLSGSNLMSESILPASWGYTALDSRQIKAVHKAFGSIPLKKFPLLNFFELCKFYGNIPLFRPTQAIKPLNLIPYDISKAKKEMEQAFGWQNYGKKHDESRFTKLFQNYWLPQKFGYEKRRAHLSSLVISGVLNRDEALAEMEKPLYQSEQLAEDIAFVCEKLEIAPPEWEKIMNIPTKRHTDYPNYEQLFNFGRGIKNIWKKPGNV